jgi:hypothetical protein
MPKRRSDAHSRRFFDQYTKIRISGFRATGVVDPAKRYALIPVGEHTKLLYTAHVRFPNGGGWSYLICPKCGKRAATIYLIEDQPVCRRCCSALNIVDRSRYGFGRAERLRERDKHLDRMQALLDTITPLRFKPAPKHWRGKAQLVSNSRTLTMRIRRSMIVCRLAMLASQQAANQGDDGLLRTYQPRADAARAIDIKPIWRARTTERLQQALDDGVTVMFEALDGNDPQIKLAAARLFLRTKQARELGW